MEAQRTVVTGVQRGDVPGSIGVDDARSARSARAASPDDLLPQAIDLSFEEAFEELYARAYGVGYQLLGTRSEAEDVAQETLARAFVHWRKVRGYAEAWVVRAAGNFAIDTWRKNSRLDHTATPDTTTPEPDSQRVDLHRALSTLSKRQREVLVLRFLADLPEADVARAIGCSPGSVKVHAARGLAALRSTMGPAQEVA
jgi:RNA polymerase sigma factor (sigma-70 family)